MGSMIAACAGSICTSMVCSALNACSGHKTGVISRIPYLFLFFFAGLFSLLMSLYGNKELSLSWTTFKACNSDQCIGNASVYRVSFCLFFFELLHVIVIGLFRANAFHWVFFPMKCILFAAALVCTFVVGDAHTSNAFFDGYADYFARYSSAVYLLIQILILISWAYDVCEYCEERANALEYDLSDSDESSRKCNGWYWVLGVSSVVLYLISFSLSICFFFWFGYHEICSLHRTLICLNLLFCALNAVLSSIRRNSSFFVSAILSFYCTFLLFTAFQADTDSDYSQECNAFDHSSRSSASLWIGYILTFGSLFYTALKSDMMAILTDTENSEDNERPLIETKLSQEGDQIVIDDQDPEDEYASSIEESAELLNGLAPSRTIAQRKSNLYFHCIMMLSSCYFAMLFTNWGTSSTISTSGQQSFWVNISCEWITVLLFWWTIIAPVVFPDRFQNNSQYSD